MISIKRNELNATDRVMKFFILPSAFLILKTAKKAAPQNKTRSVSAKGIRMAACDIMKDISGTSGRKLLYFTHNDRIRDMYPLFQLTFKAAVQLKDLRSGEFIFFVI